MPQYQFDANKRKIEQIRRLQQQQQPIDPRLVQADQLTAQAAPPPPVRGTGRQMLRGAFEGIASLGHPQGFAGYKADQENRERQRQQDLLTRARDLRLDSLQRAQLTNQQRAAALDESRFGLAEKQFDLDLERFQNVKDIQGRPKLINIPADQTYGAADPATGQFTPQGQTPKTVVPKSQNDYDRWAEQQPEDSDTSMEAFWKSRTDATQREGIYPDPTYQVRTRDASGKEVTRFFTREQTKAMAESGTDLPAANPSTGGEKRAMDFYLAAESAAKVADQLDPEISKLGLAGQTQLLLAPNFLQTDLGKSYNQAIRQFTEARLRLVSGAQVRADEYSNTGRIYFAYPGDNETVLAQKKRARAKIMDGIRQEAGRAYSEYYGEAQPGTDGGGERPRATDGKGNFVEWDGTNWVPAP